MASGDGGVEQDVAESRCAVVDRGDAQRGGRRVGHPHRHGVTDPQVAAVREHAADGHRVAVDIVERAADHVGIDGGRGRGAAHAGGRPRALVSESSDERVQLGRHDGGHGIDAAESRDRGGGAGRQGRSFGADDDVWRMDAKARHVLGVALIAGLDGSLDPGEHRHEQDRRRQGRGAPAVRRQAGGGEHPRRAETAQRRREHGGRDAEQPAPEEPRAHCEQDPAEDRERHRPEAGEQHRHRHAAEQTCDAGDDADESGPRMFDRDLAKRVGRRDAPGSASCGEDGELRDQDTHAERRHERDDRVRRRERRSDLAAIGEDVDDEIRERAARDHAQRAGHQRHEQRFSGDQPADLRWRRAQCTQHGGLAPALGDGKGERSSDHEQGNRTGDAAQSAEDGDQPSTIRRRRVAGVGIRGVPAIEDIDPTPEALLQAAAQYGRGRPGLGDHTDGVDTVRERQRAPRRRRARRTPRPGSHLPRHRRRRDR